MAAVVIAPTTRPASDPTASDPPRVRSLSVVPSAPGAVRLRSAVYWRRRAVVALVALALAAGLVQLAGRAVDAVSSWRGGPAAGAPATATDAGGGSTVSSAALVTPGSPMPSVYVVESGDTLWSIAQRIDPAGDPRPIVERLRAQAGGSALRPGQRLSLAGVR